ncbi:MAG: YdcF family protein [Anaerolineae bacterium]|jgi:SanA protein|nr:YdcF family protein [Anaerolineae bacterium]
MKPKKPSRFPITVMVLLALIFTPELLLIARFDSRIYDRIDAVPFSRYAIVFGAYVNEDGTLTDAALERTEAAVQLYQAGRVEKLFVSGTNSSHRQADVMAQYAEDRGVPAADIIVDGLGIDTHDTCRHIAALASEGVIVTQEFHLPRAMYICERSGVQGVGIAIDRLGILSSRGSTTLEIWATRGIRAVKESLLTWGFMLGIYQRSSLEAERIEQQALPE